MSYGTLKIDTITFTDNGIDKSVSVSGLVQNPSFSGDITATGTISGNIVRGQTISGVTVTGTTAAFTTGTFISLTGTTTEGTTATYTTGSFTSLTGTTTTGTTATFASGVFTTQISGATITGNAAAFTTVTGGVATITSGVFASGTAAAPSVSVGTTNNGIYSPGTDQVAISTNGTGRLFVDAGGRVGVGVSPQRPLHIDSTGTTTPVRVQGDLSQALIDFKDSTTTADFKVRIGSAGDSLIGLAGGTERLRITSDGKLGLGTSSPGGNLDVIGLSGTTIIRAVGVDTNGNADAEIFSTGTTGNSRLYFSDTAAQSGSIIYSHNNNSFAFATAGSTALTIDSSQRVGVGTTSPEELMHLNAISSGSLVDLLKIDNSGGAVGTEAGIVFECGLDRTARISSANTGSDLGALKFWTAGSVDTLTERARIDSSGRLLVGTSTYSGGAKLVVQGDASSASNAGYMSFRRNITPSTAGTSIGFTDYSNSAGSVGAYIFAESDGAWTNGSSHPTRLVFSTTADGAGSPTERFRISNNGSMSAVIPGGSTLYPASMCRAWVNFDGTGTVAIRAAYNVSSITDNGTGDYTVNFTTAMPDANYSAVGSCSVESSELATRNVALNHKTGNTAQSTSAVRLWVSDYTSNIDRAYVNVAIFR